MGIGVDVAVGISVGGTGVAVLSITADGVIVGSFVGTTGVGEGVDGAGADVAVGTTVGVAVDWAVTTLATPPEVGVTGLGAVVGAEGFVDTRDVPGTSGNGVEVGTSTDWVGCAVNVGSGVLISGVGVFEQPNARRLRTTTSHDEPRRTRWNLAN